MKYSRFSIPADLTVHEGTLVEFVVTNDDPINHELIIGDEAVHARHETGHEPYHPPVPGEVSVGPGEQGLTTFLFDSPGHRALRVPPPGARRLRHAGRDHRRACRRLTRNAGTGRGVVVDMTTKRSRPVLDRYEPIHTYEGAGFGVFRPFPQPGWTSSIRSSCSTRWSRGRSSPGEAKGAPDHPHRGFETVTYILDGEFEHLDSQGNHGRITPGDVQWMTAGAGIVHSEMPSAALQRRRREPPRVPAVGEPARRADKMITPRYQALAAADIPVASGDGWTARVISGSFEGVDGAASTHTPVTYAHVTIDAGRTATFHIPQDQNVGAYVFRGGERRFVVWERDAGAIELTAGDEPLEALVMAGRPLNEPVARYGPFVMNDRRQLVDGVRGLPSRAHGNDPRRRTGVSGRSTARSDRAGAGTHEDDRGHRRITRPEEVGPQCAGDAAARGLPHHPGQPTRRRALR